ncbi:TPA: hypothetical protein MH381_22525 [Klebsiella pneumoniae]|nr:hypothetical protein [Klebsiella pneumoniae]
MKSAKTAPRAIFNKPNGELEMPNQHIMALALALCNVEAGKRGDPLRVPAITVKQVKLLMQ